MKLNKWFVVLIVLLLVVSIVGCSSTPAPEAPAVETPAPEAPAPEAPAVEAPAPDPEGEAYEYDQVFVENVTPKLQAMVDAGDLTSERMADVIARIKTGEYQKTYVQKILSGDEK